MQNSNLLAYIMQEAYKMINICQVQYQLPQTKWPLDQFFQLIYFHPSTQKSKQTLIVCKKLSA